MTAVGRKRGSEKRRRSPARALRARLDEAEATLEAIRTGEVDAVVVSGPGGARTLTIAGATHPYHVLLDAMSDGAALLEPDGTILFSNRRLGEFARAPLPRVRGSRFQQWIAPAERAGFEDFLREVARRNADGHFTLVGRDASATPVRIAISAVSSGTYRGAAGAKAPGGGLVLMAIITDLTEQNRTEGVRLELMKRLITAEDDERRRIARELHDETGQSLTALLVGLRTIEQHARTPYVRSASQRLRNVAARTVDDVGRLARGLHPSILDDLGFAAAARRYVRDYAAAFGLAVDLRLGRVASLRLPPLVQTSLYRILQEALTNVARHARARTVTVKVGREGTMLGLVVHDDGVGFDVEAAREQATGLGLHGMRERVALLGGWLAVESRRGQGTTVRARIPSEIASPRRSRRRPRRRPTRREP